MITRKLDPRRRDTAFIRASKAAIDRGMRGSLDLVIGTHFDIYCSSGIVFRTYDSVGRGVNVVSAMSDLAHYRRQAERILGGPVKVVKASTLGTIYALKEDQK